MTTSIIQDLFTFIWSTLSSSLLLWTRATSWGVFIGKTSNIRDPSHFLLSLYRFFSLLLDFVSEALVQEPL